jgi:hypothetical protein
MGKRDYMIISIQPTERCATGFVGGKPARRQDGFTLAEVLIASTLSTFVLAGVLSAFITIGRSGFLASSYSEMEAQTRQALSIFGDDARKAANLTWNNSQSITLAVVTATAATVPITYAFDSDSSSPTYQCFYRVIGDASSTEPRRVLIRNVAPDFTFQRFKLEQPTTSDNTASSDLETKQIEIRLRAQRSGTTAVAANQSAISARYILRNKRVSN